MCDDIVAVLLRCQIICCINNLLDHGLINILSRELFEHSLNDSAATFISAQVKDLVFDQRNNELNLFRWQIQNYTLDYVVAFFTKHHFNKKFGVKLSNDLLLFIKR